MAKKEDKVLKKELTKVDYERAGKMLANIVELGYADRKRLYYLSTVKGFFSGLGGVIGATIGVALLLYLLSFFDSIPLIGRFTEAIESNL